MMDELQIYLNKSGKKKSEKKDFWTLFAMSSPGICLYKCSQPLHEQGEDCDQLYMVLCQSHHMGSHHSSCSFVRECWACIFREDSDWSNTLTLPNHWLHRMSPNTSLGPRMPRNKSRHSLRNPLYIYKFLPKRGKLVPKN